jgi:enediyne biosynthesis protein E4
MFRKGIAVGRRTLLAAGLAGLLVVLVWLAVHRPPRPPAPEGPINLHDVTAETGITFVHTDGSSGRRYIIEPMSAGLATLDYDLDGRIDIYFLNGAPLRGTHVATPPRNALYRNEGDWHFTDVTDHAGVGDLGYGLGVTVGDFDNDGFPDLYLNNFGPNLLYHNNGDGTFTDVAPVTGVTEAEMVGAGACFLDLDGDGDLDLFVGNYLRFDYSQHVERTTAEGQPTYPSPRDYATVPNRLFRNNGDGTFADASRESGIADHAGHAMGMICADADGDGDTDIFVLNDVHENFYFVNDGTGRFEELGLRNGTAYNAAGDENAGMGADCADFDRDGLLDFYMTSYQGQMPVLYRNLGQGQFQDVTAPAAAAAGTLGYVKWGTGLIDFDNDGYCDIFIVNGHTEDNIEKRDAAACYRCRNSLLRNTGQGKFVNISDQAGDGLRLWHSGRGSAFDDLDNDGDLDVVILNSREAPTVLRNDSVTHHHWLQLELHGTQANRDGVGARVQVVAGDLTLIDEVHSGRSYQSHYGSRLHFGLGRRERVDRIEVRWLGGGRDVVDNVAADQLLTVVEGGAVVSKCRHRSD